MGNDREKPSCSAADAEVGAWRCGAPSRQPQPTNACRRKRAAARVDGGGAVEADPSESSPPMCLRKTVHW